MEIRIRKIGCDLQSRCDLLWGFFVNLTVRHACAVCMKSHMRVFPDLVEGNFWSAMTNGQNWGCDLQLSATYNPEIRYACPHSVGQCSHASSQCGVSAWRVVLLSPSHSSKQLRHKESIHTAAVHYTEQQAGLCWTTHWWPVTWSESANPTQSRLSRIKLLCNQTKMLWCLTY